MTLFLLGESTGHRVVDICKRLGWGRMWVYRNIRPFEGERWGFDCGTYKLWRGQHDDVDECPPMRSELFDGDAYLGRLERARARGRPYLAVVPDLVAAGRESLAFSLDWRARLPSGLPWYLAVQDGMTVDDVRPHVDKFDGLFLGGTREFKDRTLRAWCELAHSHGRRFHYGRCSSPPRLRAARAVGADSVDSSQPLWTRTEMAKFIHAYQQRDLFLEYE